MSHIIDKYTPEERVIQVLGRRLARIRKSQGFSQARLAKEAGIGLATIKRIEGGYDGQMETWVKIFKVLNLIGGLNLLLPENIESPMQQVLSERGRKSRKKSTSKNLIWGDEQ